MPGEEHFRKLERMYHGAPINGIFHPTLRVSEGAAELRMEVRRQFHHAANALHGSVYFKMMDDAAFFAANSLIEEFFVLTVSFTVYLTRPVSEGEIRAVGRVVHSSRRLYLAEAELTNAAGQQIARGSGSFMPSSLGLTPEIGYV